MAEIAPQSDSLRVLVVEIVGGDIDAMLSPLAELGVTVVAKAAELKQANDLFEMHHPDVVMIALDGEQAERVNLAKVLTDGRRAPVIVVGSADDSEWVAQAGAAGVFGYLVKPVAPAAAHAQIQVALGRFRDIELLRKEKDHLALTLENRKLVERAKGIFMKRLGLDEAEAHHRLQLESQRRRISMAELAKKLIESEELLGG